MLSFDSTISCGVGGHLLVVYVHGTSFESFIADVSIVTDIGIAAPDAHALINLCGKFEPLEKRNFELQISLPLLMKLSSSPNSPFNCFLIFMLLDLVTSSRSSLRNLSCIFRISAR